MRPKQATKPLSSGVDTHAFLLLTVQSWAIQPQSLLANRETQLLAGSNSGLTDKSRKEARLIREFTDPIHYLDLRRVVPMQWGSGNCLSQEQRIWNYAPISCCRCTCLYTPASQKALLETSIKHPKKLQAPQQLEFIRVSSQAAMGGYQQQPMLP